jgi:hypothetical protein
VHALRDEVTHRVDDDDVAVRLVAHEDPRADGRGRALVRLRSGGGLATRGGDDDEEACECQRDRRANGGHADASTNRT